MDLKRSSRLAGTFFLAGFLALSAGCGYKTNPVPPQTVVPEAIQDLRYSLDDKGARLTWSYPVETISGDHISEILSFELYRAELPLKDFCGDCPIPFGQPIELPGGLTGEKTRATGEYVSGMLRSGNKYFFKMRSRTSYLAASKDSNIISFIYHTPAAAPDGLKAEAAGGAVSLQWQEVTTLADGKPVDLPVTYQVLKSSDGKNFAPLGARLTTTSMTDKKVESGTTYFYRVQSSMEFEGERVDGGDSSVVKVSVVDRVPPAQVTGVTVVASTSNVRIFWDASEDKDLAGYRIYKRAGGQAMSMIGEVGSNQTIFIDNDLVDGKVFYAVSAVDTDGNEGRKSEEATTRH